MKPKKSPKANLNNYSATFLLIGLVVVLFTSWRLIELKTYEEAIGIDKLDLQGDDEDETLEVNVEDIKLPPPPKQIAPPEEIEVVEDEKDVKEDVVEIVSNCNSGWKMTPADSNVWMEDNMFPFYPLGDIKVDGQLVNK